MTGGEAHSISGGDSNNGDAKNNMVSISGGNITANVSGGSATDNVIGNLVNMSGGTVIGNIYGGDIIMSVSAPDIGETGDATGNRINMSGGTASAVYGGYISVSGDGSIDVGNVVGNMVNISGGGDASTQVYGGYIENSDSGGRGGSARVERNLVNMSSGTVNTIIGGRSWIGDAVGNMVNMSGGTASAVYGGYVEVTGVNATGNIVQYSGGEITNDLFGGYVSTANPELSTENTLISIGKRSVGQNVSHFQNYRFVLDANQNTGLTVGDTFTMDGFTNRILGVDALGGGSLPKVGDKLTLVEANSTLTAGAGITAGAIGTGKKGATLLFDYNVAVDTTAKTMTATVTNVRANPQAKSLSEGVAANAAMVNIGADTVAGPGMASALAATANSAPAGTTTLAPFGTMQAGSSRFETGSHVNVSGLNLIAGIALGQQTDIGKLLIGPFFEAGFGSYNTYNSFDNAASVNGEGRTNFLGAGLLARFDFADIALGHPYLEASFRFGHAFNTYNNEDLTDAAGNSVDYDTDAPYQSFHAGLGYIFNLTETDHIDLYGKYFWSHLGGSDVKVLGDPIEFDDVNSSRLRFGGRYSHDFNTDKDYSISPYIGVAYEHEFDGKARATTYGNDIKAPSLKGDTGIGEIGVTFKHQNGLSLDLGVSGYVGKRQGVVGNMMVKYEF